MRIAIDCDKVAASLKGELYEHLKNAGYDITDLDYYTQSGGYYADAAVNLARKIAAGDYDRGILLCGTGLGVAMAACKVPGVWAGTCSDVYSATRLAASNNAQIITLGCRVVGNELAKMITEAFLKAEFEAARSGANVDRMRELEHELLHP